MRAIFRKELSDYFTSIRFLVLFLLVILASAAALYADYLAIRGGGETRFVFLKLFTTSGEAIPSLVSFLILLIPIIGISLGFDAVNKERSSGTLSQILSQPVYRDSVINGKFLAGVFILFTVVLTTILLVSGFGLRMIGVPPTAEEIIRIFLYLGFSVVYGAFWMGLGILFSTLFRSTAISLLASLGVWVFFTIFFTALIVPTIANAIAPANQNSSQAEIIRNAVVMQNLLRISPTSLFGEAITVVMSPVALETQLGLINAVASGQTSYMLASPLALSQSIIMVWPQLVSLISLTVVCFAVSYIFFMRQEVRPG